jgi:hypothetical protein
MLLSLAAVIPAPDDLGNRLWEHSPTTYLLVAGIVATTAGLVTLFCLYRDGQNKHAQFIAEQLVEHRKLEKERREDALENLRVLGSLSHVLSTLTHETEKNVTALKTEIVSAAKQTQEHVTAQIDNLKARFHDR